jgi:hypothetical protein
MPATLNTAGLDSFLAGLSQAQDEGAEEIAQAVATLERQYVAVDTGALQASIEVFGAGGSGQRTVSAGQSLDYAADQEYGTATTAAHPFVHPAVEQTDAGAIMKKHIQALASKSSI